MQLNPKDGLFLKAEHLSLIQDFAAASSRALGIALGTGVAYGYGLKLTDQGLTATAGLAIARDGGLLQTSEPLRYRLDRPLPTLEPDGFWVVEVVADEDTTGHENAYGVVCADPCDGVDAIQPLRRFLVRLLLRPDVLRGLSDHKGADRRNWLASAYFERERRSGLPWLVPGERLPGQPGRVAPLDSRDWAEPGMALDRRAVPLGVLFEHGDGLALDTWTARREVDGPPGISRWSGHLARRTWSVFLAQLLQFADEVSALGERICAGTVRKEDVVDDRETIWRTWFAAHPRDSAVGRLHDVQELEQKLEKAPRPQRLSTDAETLPHLGLGELPPAGYLGCMYEDDPRTHVRRLFDGRVDLRFCEVRADQVADAVQAAQHLDRIPLDPQADPRPQVDILVPARAADLEGTRTDANGYGWVAFVRRTVASCDETDPEPEPEPAPQTEAVEVLAVFEAVDTGVQLLGQGELPKKYEQLTTVRFAVGSDDLPTRPDKPSKLNALQIDGVVALAATADAEKLALARAAGLVRIWGLGAVKPLFIAQPKLDKPLLLIFVSEKIV